MIVPMNILNLVFNLITIKEIACIQNKKLE